MSEITIKSATKQCRDYLILEEPKASRFYMLPKIHKVCHSLQTFFCNQLSPNHALTLKTHFINILNELPTLPSGSLLFTLGVTYIPQLQGKQAIARALIKHRRNGTCPCNASIIQLLLSLKNFTFNGDH